ncbi:prepilin-type N-terminal cleavage/methylation domain-containing protein [uncultured Clostridium sp.]|uniref:type II secretion system protein n=1 Tax=uncultured Clostridium sp. TaxID=59620 RepID=UPI00261EF427|nr:prepilin-type N-terminal cleavage/methylation domain-containing protein [uncultured Clostridium sp.]
MRKMIQIKKKKGFTLIEMVAVIAIIGILAAILVPKISGYMKEAKKIGVIDQARRVGQAYETAKMKGTNKLESGELFYDQTSVDTAIKNTTIQSLIENSELDKLGKLTEVKIQHCLAIVAGSDFTIDKKGILEYESIDLEKSPSDRPEK